MSYLFKLFDQKDQKNEDSNKDEKEEDSEDEQDECTEEDEEEMFLGGIPDDEDFGFIDDEILNPEKLSHFSQKYNFDTCDMFFVQKQSFYMFLGNVVCKVCSKEVRIHEVYRKGHVLQFSFECNHFEFCNSTY